MMQRVWLHLSDGLVRRSRLVLLVAAAVTVGLALAVPQVEFKTSHDTIVDPSSAVYKANERQQGQFGGESMFVMFTGDVRQIFTAGNLRRLDRLETSLRETGRYHAVIGPLTALRYAQDQLKVAPELLTAASERQQAAAAQAARRDAAVRGAAAAEQERAAAEAAGRAKATADANLMREFVRLGEVGEQRLDNPAFGEFLLFDADGKIRPILGDAFPDTEHALMVVRLKGNQPIAEFGPDADEVRRVVAANPVEGFESLVTGPPVLLQEINDYLQGGMAVLGLIAVGVMILVLWLVFRVRWRLLPLAVVAIGTVWAFGLMGLLGIPLSMVTISGLPIFIGLGVDFAIQMQNRFEEEHATAGQDAPGAARESGRHMAPPLLVTMMAAVVGFLALLLSRVPMIRHFGLMLSVGVIALVAAAVVVTMGLVLFRERHRPTAPWDRGARSKLLERVVEFLTSLPGAWVLPVVFAGLVIAGAGLVLEGRLGIETDPERWVSQSGRAATELEQLRDGTRSSSELDVLIEADDVTSTAVVSWMYRFAEGQLADHPEAIMRATSLPQIVAAVTETAPTASDVRTVLSVTPSDVRNALISPDRTKANLVFPIANLSLAERAKVVDQFERDLQPPPGVTATPAGLAVEGIEVVDGLEAGRRVLTLASLALVAIWLLVLYRSLTRALIPLVPVVSVVGLSTVALYLLGMELTPLTTVAAPLVIAVCTEFSVLIESRYIEERRRGRSPRGAVETSARYIGRAFVASGLTLLGGFAVLAFSPMPLLRDFGVVVAIDVVIALLTALVVLPPLLVWADERPWLRRFPPLRPAEEPVPPTPLPEPVASGPARS